MFVTSLSILWIRSVSRTVTVSQEAKMEGGVALGGYKVKGRQKHRQVRVKVGGGNKLVFPT